MPTLETRYDEDADRYDYGFELDGAFVPVGNLAGSTVRGHVEAATDTDRRQFPQKDS